MGILIRRFALLVTFAITFVGVADPLPAATASPLFARGYTVIPEPQKVTLGGTDFEVAAPWRLEFGPGVKADDVAVVSLREDLRERFHLGLSEAKGEVGARLKLAIDAHAVEVGESTDCEKSALAEQAYRMKLTPAEVTITGNGPAGLFYGLQTLVQLLKPKDGKLWLPEGEIVDWPDLQLRVIYWDDAHHLERLEVLKAAVRQAAFYKINGFSIKLEGHFQYKHAQPIVEPYAMTQAELQELSDYALKYHGQLIPYLDGPAHDAFILKHPEYAGLREFAESNYEFCVTNPDTYKLFYGMFDDLLEATKGSKYFVLSTDEPYFVGIAKNAGCDEVSRAKELGSNGKLLAEFVTKTAGYLHERGREVIFWGEYPLEPDDGQRLAKIPDQRGNLWPQVRSRVQGARHPAVDLHLDCGMEGVSFPRLLCSSLGAGASRAFGRRLPAGEAGTRKSLPNVQIDFLHSRARTGRSHGQLRCRMGGHGLAPRNVLARICGRIGCGVAARHTRACGA